LAAASRSSSSSKHDTTSNDMTSGPDAEVLIGQRFKPFYAQDRGTDLGVASWPPDAWRIGGGTVWGWLTYDPEAELLYHGTANPGPWNPEQRPGDNKWTAGIFARDADTGEAVWFSSGARTTSTTTTASTRMF
jgi:lanthanide-dependent methanol dehydrogenase